MVALDTLLAALARQPFGKRQYKVLLAVLSLSLGYHHETPGAFVAEPLLIAALRRLSELGVVVVAGAGNDGSNVEFFPAAFAATGLPGAPMVSVGARTTSEHEVAIWSNTE